MIENKNKPSVETRAFRSAKISAVNSESRTVELAFSSEFPALRSYGYEVLSHAPGAVILDRLKDGAPLLLDHEPEDQIGVTEEVSIDADRRGRAVVRFGKSPLADQIFQDVQDLIRRHVSVGYIIREVELTGQKDGIDVWTVKSWEPFEISIVPVPVDHTVGVGRSMKGDSKEAPISHILDNNTMSQEEIKNQEATPAQPIQAEVEAKPVNVEAVRSAATDAERTRTRSIIELGEKFKQAASARSFIEQGKSASEFQSHILNTMNTQSQTPITEQRSADIGLTDKEVNSFSFMKVIRALANPSDMKARKEAAFEFEASEAASRALGKDTGRFLVPSDVLTRALNTATGPAGGYAVATTTLAGSFIEQLRNKAVVLSRSTVMGGLVGNVDVPKHASGATAYWLGEGADATGSDQTLGQVALSPKTVAAFSDMTRRMVLQSSVDVEALVRSDLAKVLGLAIDKAAFYGSGANAQPLGITNQVGVNAVAFAAATPTFAELVAMETAIATANADVESMAYVANAAFRGYAKSAVKFPGTAGTIWEAGNTVNGYACEVTNQVNAGHVIFGNFQDLLIGLWGGLEISVDTASLAKSGGVRILAFQDCDIALRRPESFTVGKQ